MEENGRRNVTPQITYSKVFTLSNIFGWIYFTSWSISFYPQIYENKVRKCVIGLNFDFLAFNILGFVAYSAFNCGLYFVEEFQIEYREVHPQGSIPVMLNDVIFSVHAAIATLFTIFQCCIYERGSQKVSITATCFLILYMLIIITGAILAFLHMITWLQFLYCCSYIKLSISLIKYVPQAYMNYTRKSTKGWSIGNILLDFIGGIFSMLQLFIDSYDNGDWTTLHGDLTKFGLGLFSVLFDILFMCQHFWLYRPLEV